MSIEKETPFVLFIKSIYEVRPKKNLKPSQTHHWKLQICSFKNDKDIKRVEFHLHDTFVEPIQIIKKPPFKIEEDGFGNFEMRINIKILNRTIPLTFFIELLPNKFFTVQYHHSLWMVKPKEFEKVLEIGGIPMKSFDNTNDQCKALSKLSDLIKKREDQPFDPSAFYPNVYQRVIQKIKSLNHTDSIPKTFHHNADMDMGHSDDSSYARQSQGVKQHRHNTLPTVFDQELKIKNKSHENDLKKEMKRKRNISESSSESDAGLSHENLFGKHNKKIDTGSIVPKSSEIKQEKLLKLKPDFKQEPIISKMPMKPSVKVENKLQKPPKEPKLKLKIKDTNPDSFSKLFDAPDLIVVNKGKVNLANAAMNHENLKRKVNKKEHLSSDHNTDESRLPKKSIKSENQNFVKDSRDVPKSVKMFDATSSKPLPFESKKIKPPEKTMPPDKKKEKMTDHKNKVHNSNFYSKPRSSRSSNDSEVPSPSSKSSSDNDIDSKFFQRKSIKKSPTESNKIVGVKQLFGDDDNDLSDDDDDQPDDIADLFSVLKNSTGLHPSSNAVNVPSVQHHQKSLMKSTNNDECGSSSDNDTSHNKPPLSLNSPRSKFQNNLTQKIPTKDRNMDSIKNEETIQISGQMVPIIERTKLAKTLLKIKNKKFFAKLQRLLLTSFEKKEKSVSFDPESMRLDFNMGDVSDTLVNAIQSLVDEYSKDNVRSVGSLHSAQ